MWSHVLELRSKLIKKFEWKYNQIMDYYFVKEETRREKYYFSKTP